MKKILDWKKYEDTARQTVAEGCVLLKNNGVLPFKKEQKISIFGRIQNYYYKSGTGSGGMVNVSKVTDIPEGLRKSGHVKINEELSDIYKKWEETHPINEGIGWGNEPWSQDEMDISETDVKRASEVSDVALCIIGRTAGEDRDVADEPGSYRLTEIEESLLEKVRKNFENMVVLLNVGGIIDMGFEDKYKPDAVMYVWQGGMTGGDGTADVLTGKVSPSGHLTTTISYSVSDNPADKNFGNDDVDFYSEDIYVGYRYFETFAKDKVRYPFGYGLSYTEFETKPEALMVIDGEGKEFCGINGKNVQNALVRISVRVTNTGKAKGKQVVQIYASASGGRLGKPEMVLCGFAKTKELNPGEKQTVIIDVDPYQLASYDDSGISGYQYCSILEKGEISFYAGDSIRNVSLCETLQIEYTIVVEQFESALAPVRPFERIKLEKNDRGENVCGVEPVPWAEPSENERRVKYMPAEIQQTDTTYKLKDVVEGNLSIEEFVAQLNDDDLCCIIRGEGMGSSKVTPGTAAAFAGANKRLQELGVPAVCCDDGPSGMRLDSGVKAFSMPNGTMEASTFNTELVSELYSFTGLEMTANRVDNLLGPGINIQRHPFNGRNFEYFSEDPYLTGKFAIAILKGLHISGASGTIKHFCGNNQEHRRNFIDSVISERALREIYLKGFEMAVKSGYARSIMTTYGSVNGLWTAGNFDLNTTILRKQWGYKGIVMTDWWAAINERGGKQCITNYAQMVRSQNDLYMVCSDSSWNKDGDNIAEALADGRVNRSELQRSACNILRFTIETEAMRRMMGNGTEIEIINRKEDEGGVTSDSVIVVEISDEAEIRLDDRESKAGTDYIITLDMEKTGMYRITLTGSSALSEVAQIPCTLFSTGIPVATFSFRGSADEDRSIERTVDFYSRFSTMRLHVARNGLKLKSMKIEYAGKGQFIDGNR